jgi:hypothetical protein
MRLWAFFRPCDLFPTRPRGYDAMAYATLP